MTDQAAVNVRASVGVISGVLAAVWLGDVNGIPDVPARVVQGVAHRYKRVMLWAYPACIILDCIHLPLVCKEVGVCLFVPARSRAVRLRWLVSEASQRSACRIDAYQK